jgi:hypothetical protein
MLLWTANRGRIGVGDEARSFERERSAAAPDLFRNVLRFIEFKLPP